MSKHKVIIETNGVLGKITIDGNEIHGVTGYEIEHRAGDIPRLHLTLNCDLQVISDEMLIPLPEPWGRICKIPATLNGAAEPNG